jgi:hypothetical protein
MAVMVTPKQYQQPLHLMVDMVDFVVHILPEQKLK